MAIILGIVAVATTWSGYQAARWSGVQSADYSRASALRVEATQDETLAGQATLYDLNLFDEWLNAHAQGNATLAAIYERRFRPEFRPAFNAWLATNPFNNRQAPPGPFYMPQYKVSLADDADTINQVAQQTFAAGQSANETSDNYVLNTVLLATVLLLAAIGERFSLFPVQVAILLIASGILVIGLVNLVRYPIR
jgi:hypothetical protein